MLGWDITDYGMGDFDKFGFSLITIRNGNRAMADKYPKVYAEKLLYLKEGQYAPNHFHWFKTEDIINRGGGNVLIRVYNSLPNEEINLSIIDEAKVFYFGTLSLTDEPARSATYKTVAYAREQGKLITYDPNLRKPLWRSLEECKEQMLWGLSQADVVKISDEEVEFLFGLGVAEGAAYILNHYGVKLVFVTCGADGCYFKNALACGHVPSLSGIKVVDTTGACDIFGGSAVWKLLQLGKTPDVLTEAELRNVVTFACISAGLSTTKPGGISSVPNYIDIINF